MNERLRFMHLTYCWILTFVLNFSFYQLLASTCFIIIWYLLIRALFKKNRIKVFSYLDKGLRRSRQWKRWEAVTSTRMWCCGCSERHWDTLRKRYSWEVFDESIGVWRDFSPRRRGRNINKKKKKRSNNQLISLGLKEWSYNIGFWKTSSSQGHAESIWTFEKNYFRRI
jgi:hypothetical protein